VGILRIRAMVFDFDGTLVPFKIDYIALRKGIINRIIPFLKSDISKDIFDVNDPIRVTLKKARELLNEKDMEYIERNAEEIISFYELEGTKDNEIPIEVPEVLKTLKEMNIKLGIFTLNQKNVVELLLNRANLFKFFDAIVTRTSVREFYENIIKLKYLRTCLEKLQVKGEETVVIGDHPIDIEAGKHVNAITVGVHTPRNGKELLKDKKYDYLIHSIPEIVEIVEHLLDE
jgi:HAD superfamily hydrolase (TIGR01549 family)